MVSPSPELERKIRNTKNLIKQKKSHLISEFKRKEPHNFIDENTHNKLEITKPWVENIKPKKHTQKPSSSNHTSQLKILQPTIQDRLLIVCVDFIDKPAQISIPTIYNRFFSTTEKSLKQYFTENSYGQYIPEGEVHGWYRAPQPYTYYVNNDNGFGTYPNNIYKLVEDIVDIISQDTNINFSYIDIDNNRIIDNLIIVHSGAEAAYTGTINDLWAHVSYISPRLRNGYGFQYYATVSEFMSYSTDLQRSGIDCHEFAHLIGLPDLYDYTGLSNGVGLYSLMSHGSWGTDYGITPTHLDAYSKYYLGYTNTLINQIGTLTIENSEFSNINYLYTTQYSNEYFIIENRQKQLYDINLPATGILIWKINELQSTNNNKLCFKVALIQADNQKHLENQINYGDSGDSYPGSTNKYSFSRITTPSSILCDSTYPTNDIIITNISNSSNMMTFNATINPTCIQPTCMFTLSL